MKAFDEFAGRQIWIESSAQPAFYAILFHVNDSVSPIAVGATVTEGQYLGVHAGIPDSDIAIGVVTPAGWRLVSYFDVMTDAVFSAYSLRGVAGRDSAILTRVQRDADPLTCSGETFTSAGTLPVWLILN